MNYVLSPNAVFISENELCHYGVKGMKWGIRRYQNTDGTLTSAGRKKAKQEYRADNKAAYELGRKATLYGYASARSTNRTNRLSNKLSKRLVDDPNSESRRTNKLQKKRDASVKTTEELTEKYKELSNKAEKHCEALIDKYGKEAVTSIKYTDLKVKNNKNVSTVKTMNERTSNFSDHARATGMTITAAVLTSMAGIHVTPIFYTKSKTQQSAELEYGTYVRNLKR